MYLLPGTRLFRVPDDLPDELAGLLGCGRLVAIDRLPSRLALAAELGATLTLDAATLDEDEVIALAVEHTGGRGPDVVLDCSGAPQTFVTSLRMVRVGGAVVESGAFVDLGPVAINPNADICTRDVSVLGIGGETAESYGPAMELLARNRDQLPIERMVTHTMALEDAERALAIAQADGAMKVLLSPDAAPAP